jgi:hypothetical protein
MELDEMWHYVGSKKTSYGSGRLLVELQTNLLIESVGPQHKHFKASHEEVKQMGCGIIGLMAGRLL